MDILVMRQSMLQIESDMVIVPIFEGTREEELDTDTRDFDQAMGRKITALLQDGEITGKFGEVTVIHNLNHLTAKKVMILGAGKKTDLCCDRIRQLAATALQHCRKCHTAVVTVPVAGLTPRSVMREKAAQALIEGALLGLYTFDAYKSQPDEKAAITEKIIVVENSEAYVESVRKGINNGKIFAEATNFARDLVNHPGNFMSPALLADRAVRVAENNSLHITVLEQSDMEREGMGALLAVARGSAEYPKLIVLKYQGDPQAETIAFIGKGITFDSGGISLKPSEGMGKMKEDMAGGAAVIGAMLAIGKLRPRVNVLGIIPAAENMPGGNALKPGDIIRSMSGKTIEIVTTDAEGRLILADAVTYARRMGANKLVDVATLTGACVIALGGVASGVVSNDREWCQAILRAGAQTGENMWELPNYQDYKEQIKGGIADLKNSGGRHAGAITAGLFIGEFAEDIPWVHIDIAGTASTDKPKGYQVKGATGVMVRALVQLVLDAEQ